MSPTRPHAPRLARTIAAPLLLTLLLLPALASPPPATDAPTIERPSRLALGRLLQECDDAWLSCDDPAAKARAVPLLSSANTKWMRGEISETARDLARALGALRRPEGATAAELWAGSLSVMPERRTVDANIFAGSDSTGGTVPFVVAVHYGDAPPPEEGGAIEISGPRFPTHRVPVTRTHTPSTILLRIPEGERGDFRCTVRIVAGDTVLRSCAEAFGIVPVPYERYTRAIEGLAEVAPSLPRQTVFGLGKQLFRSPTSLEIPLPPAAALARVERLADLARRGEPDPSIAAPGDHWFVMLAGVSPTPCRVLVPPHEEGEKLPLVVAVHGMGGSEQNFFEIYGRGLAARLAAEHGWILASPGGLAMIGTGAPVNDIVTALEEILPVDPERIFLIGHSLGAMRVTQAAGEQPARYRAIAPLSGTGPVPPGTDLARLPAFVAGGDQDFGLGMAQVLRSVLEGANAAVTWRTVPNSEHIMMVPDVLPEVFRFFAATLEEDSAEPAAGSPTPSTPPRDPRD